MDKNFLQFWSAFLTSYVRGQQQMEEMTRWIQQGFKGFDELTALFQKAYGLDRTSDSASGYLRMWERAIEDFERSFSEYLAYLGVVPRKEHLELIEKYENLKNEVGSQEETIKNLRELLAKKHLAAEDYHRAYQELMTTQTEEFQKLVQSMGEYFKPGEQTERPGKTAGRPASQKGKQARKKKKE
ncbi:MAG: hypothetical protein JXO48_03940 [Deltaproteobacteria bacterium]|nr:hypothetical protein [Deltaproteobacteria bacterium]